MQSFQQHLLYDEREIRILKNDGRFSLVYELAEYLLNVSRQLQKQKGEEEALITITLLKHG